MVWRQPGVYVRAFVLFITRQNLLRNRICRQRNHTARYVSEFFRRYLWKMWKRRTADTEGSSGFQAILHTEQWFLPVRFCNCGRKRTGLCAECHIHGKIFPIRPGMSRTILLLFRSFLKVKRNVELFDGGCGVASLSLFLYSSVSNKGYCPDPKLWFLRNFISP